MDDIAEQQRQDFAQYAFNVRDHYWHIFGGFLFPTYAIMFYYGSSLDELMRYMYQKFSYGLRCYRAEDIRDACSAITEKDYTDFFDKYVFGNKALPFDEEKRCAYFGG